jgi:S-adenosylmethionine-dependent methyltransferase
MSAAMIDDTKQRFDAGAEAWSRYNQAALGRIRREVTWHNLAPYLPPLVTGQEPPRILDAGGGSGELASQLLQRGYAVWLLDYAPAMLEQAKQAARTLPGDVQARLTLCPHPVDEAAQSFAPGFFDAIACHTLLEYLPEPGETLGGLAKLLRGGGLLSLSFVNCHAEVLRQVWSRDDPAGAVAKLEDHSFCAGLFGIAGRAHDAEEVSGWLEQLGLVVTAHRGVRALADYVPRERLEDAEFLEALLALEKMVASRPPYSLIARYVHLLAHKSVEHS